MEVLAKPLLDDVDQLEKIKPTDCSKRYLAKKYISIGDLQADNNKDELYYDAELDDTPYTLLDKYKEKQKELSPDLFKKFLMETLIHKHDVSEENADDIASILIAGKKPVVDGEYAIVEIKPTLDNEALLEQLTEEEKDDIAGVQDIRKKTYYYKRVKSTWVRDNDINEDSFIDTNALFCNIAEDCKKNDTNNRASETRTPPKRIKKIINKISYFFCNSLNKSLHQK